MKTTIARCPGQQTTRDRIDREAAVKPRLVVE